MTPFTERYGLLELQRLHDEARVRAHVLRREAFDDFWRGASGLVGDATLSTARAARRLAHRLNRLRRREPLLSHLA